MSYRRLRCGGVIISFLSIFFIFIISTYLEPLIQPFIFLIDNTHLSASDLITISSVFAALGLTLTSISYSAGEWYTVFNRFRNLGIFDGLPNRKGRATERTSIWMDEIAKADNRIILSGTTLSGWFDTAWSDLLDNLPTILNNVDSFKIFLLNPTSEYFSVRSLDEAAANELPNEILPARAKRVYSNILTLFDNSVFTSYIENGVLSIAFYDGTPLPLVVIDTKLYFTPYLTFFQNKECPQLSMKYGESFSDRFMKSINRIEKHETTVFFRSSKEFSPFIQTVSE